MIQKIKQMSNDSIDIFVQMIYRNHSLEFVDKLKLEAVNMCYDRQLCKQLGVDYNTIPTQDYHKLMLYAYMVRQ